MKKRNLIDPNKNFTDDNFDDSILKIIPLKSKKQNKRKEYKKSKPLSKFFLGFLNSMIPFNFNFNKNIFYSAGLCGPVIICGIVSNLITGLIIFLQNYKIREKIISVYITKLKMVSIIIYSFAFGVSFFNTIILNLINKKKLKYFHVLNIFAYSINCLTPILIFSYFIESYKFLTILELIGFLSLVFFIILNIFKILEVNLSIYKKIFVFCIEIILLVNSINLVI